MLKFVQYFLIGVWILQLIIAGMRRLPQWHCASAAKTATARAVGESDGKSALPH
jgi:hypothetical protein